jgi:transposase
MVLLHEVAGRLQAQVKQTTQAVNRLHNLLARTFPELATLTDDISAAWVLRLLQTYPTAERIVQAHRTTLAKIPYLSDDRAAALHQAAQNSVASLRGATAEALIRALVRQLRHCQRAEKEMRQLLITTYDSITLSPHAQVKTIPGIGVATAAVLVAKIVDIRRFETSGRLVGYFGFFPEENRSGVDKSGKPLPPGTMSMSLKGNDLVRGYLWNAARTAIRCNPPIRALYARLKAKGKRGDVALGHCARKLLHLVFAVWKTNRPFDPEHFAWEPDKQALAPAAAGDGTGTVRPAANEAAVGHKRDVPAREVVTTASSTVAPARAAVKPPAERPTTVRPKVSVNREEEPVAGTRQEVAPRVTPASGSRGRPDNESRVVQ